VRERHRALLAAAVQLRSLSQRAAAAESQREADAGGWRAQLQAAAERCATLASVAEDQVGERECQVRSGQGGACQCRVDTILLLLC
jgi:hypothetical protein